MEDVKVVVSGQDICVKSTTASVISRDAKPEVEIPRTFLRVAFVNIVSSRIY